MKMFNKLSPEAKKEKKEVALRRNFLKAIENRRCATAINILLGASDDEEALLLQLSGEDGGNLLHLLAQYQASAELLAVASDFITTNCEESDTIAEVACDNQGRTPLHVAMIHGCGSYVTEFLLKSDAGALPAFAKDESGRYPLHYACANPNGSSTFSSVRCSSVEMFTSILLLLNCEPMTAYVADNNGRTPLDLAQRNDAHMTIQHLLEKATDKPTPSKKQNSGKGTDATGHESCFSVPTIVSASFEDDLSSMGGYAINNNNAKEDGHSVQRSLMLHNYVQSKKNEIPLSLAIYH
jgi:hypothetical protein